MPQADPTPPQHFDAYAQDGPQPVVTVDPAGLTLLASAGMELLFPTIERARSLGLAVDLVAPNGSPAQHLLSLVQLPYQQPPARP